MADWTTNILTAPLEKGATGERAALDRPAAGKTGTAEKNRAAWFVGYTPQLSTAVWMGYTDRLRTIQNVGGFGLIFGGTVPAKTWHTFMEGAMQGLPVIPFATPGVLPQPSAGTRQAEKQDFPQIVRDCGGPCVVMPTLTTPPTTPPPPPPGDTAPPSTTPPETTDAHRHDHHRPQGQRKDTMSKIDEPILPTGDDHDDHDEVDEVEVEVDDDVTGQVAAPVDVPPADEGSKAPSFLQSWSKKRSEWRKVERARRYAARKSVRFPIFTRSVLLWVFIFALIGVAFGTSGVFWWAHFNTEVAQLRDDTKDFEQREQGAAVAIDAQRNQALTQINDAIQPLSGLLDEVNTVKLAQAFSEKVWIVDTLDDAGKPAAGSAFAVVTDDKESLMVTSYAVVKASTVKPGPDIRVRRVGQSGTEEVKADLWSVDPAHDLALLSVPRANIPLMDWAGDEAQAKALGSRAFGISGWGGNGTSITPGIIVDTNSDGFRFSGAIGTDWRGGPIITTDGKILGVASLDYQPKGFNPGEIHDAVFVPVICQGVLSCGGGIKTKGNKNVPPDSGRPPATAPQPGVPQSLPPRGRRAGLISGQRGRRAGDRRGRGLSPPGAPAEGVYRGVRLRATAAAGGDRRRGDQSGLAGEKGEGAQATRAR